MLVDTIAKKQAHPQMSKIPDFLWNSPTYFSYSFNDDELNISGKKFVEVIASDLPGNKYQALTILTFCYPDASTQQLMEFASTQLQLTEKEAFRISAALGRLDALKWLAKKAPDELQAMIEVDDFNAFFEAAANGHLDILKRIKEQAPGEFQAMIEVADFAPFTSAAAFGQLDILKWMKEQAPGEFQAMIEVAFFAPAANGQLDTLKWLTDECQAMIKENDYAFYDSVFCNAAVNGHLDIVEWVVEQAPDELQAMIAADEYIVFCEAAKNGHLDTLKWLAKKAPDKLQAMIAADDYVAFHEAAGNGHLDILKWLAKQAPSEFQYMIKAADTHGAFTEAARKGHLDALKWLAGQAPGILQDMMTANNNYYPFRLAAINGHLDTLKWLADQAPDELQAMIAVPDVNGHYCAFRKASFGGHLGTLKWMAEQAPDKLHAMIAASNYAVFDSASRQGNFDITKWLLRDLGCFAHAEQHEQEYALHVIPFVQNTLRRLHQSSEAAFALNPNTVFDVEDEQQARFCFYLMRNIIRRNDRALDDELRFLLSIPAVKALAHQEVTPGNSNELLRLAMATGNTEASTLLLNIDTVRVLAEQNDFYRGEAVNGVNLRQLAQDRESSMTALTTGEAKRLENAIAHYKPIIKTAGIAHIMQALKDELVGRYEKNPASFIDSQGNTIMLPLGYEAFQSLKLTEPDNGNARKAYYNNNDHTAWRYLSKPNAWMHPNASYVYISDDRTQRWSTFEEYQPLIAMFYLAATDSEVQATQGHNLETRLAHFINELGLIGRAHNWDGTRIRNGMHEEYDDLQGDRPSCFSGVKRRLFQSVVGHPLFEVLDEDKIEAEIRQFAVEHFQSIITEENKSQFKKIFDECYGLDEEGDGERHTKQAEQLGCLDISQAKQDGFINYLTKKYGDEFTQNKSLVSQVHTTFSLDPKGEDVYRRYHAFTLFSLTNLSDFLNPTYRIVNEEKETPLISLKSTSKQNRPEPELLGAVINAVKDFCDKPEYKEVAVLAQMRAIIVKQESELGLEDKLREAMALADLKKQSSNGLGFFQKNSGGNTDAVERFCKVLAGLKINDNSCVASFIDSYSDRSEYDQSNTY